MTFDSAQTVASWDWQTANDAPARDPAKWTLEGSNDGGAWTVLDDSWATDKFDTTSARYTWQGPFVVTVGRDCDSSGNTGGGGIPNGGVSLGGDGQLVKDTRLPYVTIPLDYEIGLDITPGPVIQSDWASIVHFTATDSNCCNYGSRIPGVWFWPGTRKILVVDGHGANGNSHTGEWGCNDDTLTLDEGQKYRLTMAMTASSVYIYVNGEIACDNIPRADRTTFESVSVYMADPWYVEADAVVGNLYLLGDGADIVPPPPPPPPPNRLNAALGKDTSQSSEGWGGAASRAVDGNTDGSWGGASCTHTQNGNPEWFQVDLGSSMTVADVNIYHRTDCCQNRLSSGDGAQVIISDTSDYSSGTVCGNVVTAEVDVVQCGNGQGRFVTVVHANDYITICEIEVTAWAPPMGAQMLGGDGPLVRNTQLNDVTIPLDYEIGLDITPGSNIVGDWAAIVHFTADGTNCCNYGSRIPGVWFWPGTRKILVVDGHGDNGNSHTGEWGCDDDILTLEEGKTANLIMRMTLETVRIMIDGTMACDAIPRSDRQVWENTQVWAADNWYAPADAEISGLYLYDPANLAQAIDVQDGYAHTVFNEQDWWLVRRDHQASDGWHPVNDDLAGTADAYGVMSTDPLADSTWNVPFGDGTDLLLASGDFSMWVTMTRAEIAAKCGSCSNCRMALTGSSGLGDPRQYCRAGAMEDPWISAGDHPNQIVYGENGDANMWHTGTDGTIDALNVGGSNVWVSAAPPAFVSEECDGENMSLDWTGGFHESGHNVFDNTNRLHDAADFVDAQIVISDPLDGCMGVPMDGSAATGGAITGTYADGSMTGKIALIRRGACYFTSKTINAQNAGAVAAVIYNDDRAGLVTMSGPDVGVTIPAIFIDGRVGDSINEAVAADPSLTFSLHCGTVTRYLDDRVVIIDAEQDLVRGTELDPIDLPLDYTLGFTLTPGSTVVGEWANIVHISATGNNCCNYGDRIPGIWFYGNTRRMHIRDGTTSSGNAGCDPAEELAAETPVDVRVEFRAGAVEVFYDDRSVCDASRVDGRTTHEGAKVWASDPFYPAIDGKISNFFVVKLPPVSGCMTRGACNFDKYVGVDDGSCVMPEAGKDCDGNQLYLEGVLTLVQEETQLARATDGDALAVINLPMDFALEFTLTPSDPNVGEWANILHFTIGGNCCSYGQRIPGIWFYGNTRRLHIRDGHGANGNEGCDPAEELPADEATRVRVVMTADGVEVFYNDVSKCTGDRGDRTAFTDVQVYVSDPWYPPANAKIQNINIIPMDSGDELIPGATYITANPMTLEQNNEMAPVDLPLDYTVGFTMTPGADTVGDWANIIHISATGNNCCSYGDRIPGECRNGRLDR
eukprot:COSAG04_NODE_868_length_9754_cov_10.610254_6_plen_1356_part_00